MNIRSRVERLERVAGLEQQQSKPTGALPWWHHIDIAQRRMVVALGDVSGKGVPASLFMAVTKTLFKATAGNSGTPGEILARLNRA